MKKKAIQELLGDFDLNTPVSETSLTKGTPLTLWMPVEYKERFGHLQKMTKRRFGKKVREVIQELIDAVEDQAS